MSVIMQLPDMLGRKSLGVFTRRFQTWICDHHCDHPLKTFSIIKPGNITRSILEVTHGRQLVAQSNMVWEDLNKAVEKNNVILSTVAEIAPLFESLSRTVTCTRELISIYMCYSQGEGLNSSLSRLFYLVLYTVVQLSICLCTLYSYGTKYPMCWVLMMNDI